MQPFTAYRRDGKLVLEIDERRFLADATRSSDERIAVVDRDAFLEFALKHIFTLTHDVDQDGAHPSWWLRLTQALANAAASSNRGLRRSESVAATCGCDPEEHDGG